MKNFWPIGLGSVQLISTEREYSKRAFTGIKSQSPILRSSTRGWLGSRIATCRETTTSRSSLKARSHAEESSEKSLICVARGNRKLLIWHTPILQISAKAFCCRKSHFPRYQSSKRRQERSAHLAYLVALNHTRSRVPERIEDFAPWAVFPTHIVPIFKKRILKGHISTHFEFEDSRLVSFSIEKIQAGNLLVKVPMFETR